MKDLVSEELRRLHRKVQQSDRRMGLVDISGKVKPGSQDMQARTVVLVIGQSRDGQDILSPPVRWQATGAAAFKMHATPADNEQMVLHSPSGTIGNGSMAHWGTYDQDNQPPSQSKDEVVLQFGGKATITFGKDYIRTAFADDQFVKIKESGDVIVAIPDKGTLYLGGDPDKGGDFELVTTVTGPAKATKAKVG